MGGGSYSTTARNIRSTTLGYDTKSPYEIFSQKDINSAMSPYGIDLRESRDSDEHPESLAIIIALDVTGSMGSVPHYLVKEGLPNIMERIIKGGIKDPQVLFLAIGDHECDRSPLQVGQFESNDELLDKWLTDVYLEGGGGANGGESYHLAWFFASNYTDVDCFLKRNQKGFLFTVGDEPVLKDLPARTQKNLMGDGQYSNTTAFELFDKVEEMYNTYHINVCQTRSGKNPHVQDGWKQMIADRLLLAPRREDVSDLISSTILNNYKSKDTIEDVIESVEVSVDKKDNPIGEEIIL